jgi:uncharacterized surface protein with fasciclin (FAS1) repeats
VAFSGDLTNGQIVTPLNPANTIKLTVTTGGNVFANQAQVNLANVPASNGVVHSLDAVIVVDETVVDIAIGTGVHTTLVAAVIQAELLPALTDPFASLTVFAPTDAAFTAALTELGLTAAQLLASPDLADILLYHVLGAEVLSGDLTNGDLAQPLNTANTLKVTIDGTDVFINQAQVTTANVGADNGVVHVLDAVVLPNETVADIAIGTGVHTTLVAAVIEARLLPALTDPFASLTVFAPTDAAFTAALTELGLTAAQLLASPDLADILLYHVLGAEVLSGDLTNGDLAQPLNTANTLKVTIDGTDVFINQAQVTTANVGADNGVVHVLDAVVLPNETVADIAIGTGVHTTLVAAVIEARLLPALTDPFASLTVFAPTDAAFTAALTELGLTAAQLLASPDLADILLYHVLGAEVLSGDLTNGDLAQPLNTANTLKVTIDGTDVFINQAQVTTANVGADNGVVHVLGAVVLPNETVADIAIGTGVHTTLVAAVIEARLLPALTDPFASLTVFAPTDAAFTAALTELGLTAAQLLASPDLADILLYHVLGAEVLSGDLTNGDLAQPLNTANTLKVTIDGTDVFINQAQVTTANVGADNGVVHVLGAVVLPNETVAEMIAIGTGVHTTLVAAVIEARLLPALTDPFASLTVFGPTDAAFTTFLTGAGITAGDLLASPDLVNILLYHVLGTEVLSTDLVNGPVTTLSGGTLTVDLTMGVMINDANVTTADVLSDNGVVHVIDAVLIDATASLPAVATEMLSTYPNPAVDMIQVKGANNGTFAIVSMSGAVVKSGLISNQPISVSELNAGTYMINITTEAGSFRSRFVKM